MDQTPWIETSSLKFVRGDSKIGPFASWYQEKDPIGLVFLGRSNVGKSTLINGLFNQNLARVSKTPGRTQQINTFEFHLTKKFGNLGPFYLFDLPGFGHAKVSKEMQENWKYLMGEFFHQLNDKSIFLHIQDARHPGEKKDLELRQFLREFFQPKIVIFNKVDKLKTQKDRAQLKKKLLNDPTLHGHGQQLYQLSGLKKTGMQALKLGILNFLFSYSHQDQSSPNSLAQIDDLPSLEP